MGLTSVEAMEFMFILIGVVLFVSVVLGPLFGAEDRPAFRRARQEAPPHGRATLVGTGGRLTARP